MHAGLVSDNAFATFSIGMCIAEFRVMRARHYLDKTEPAFTKTLDSKVGFMRWLGRVGQEGKKRKHRP